jgi:hypothetical protein
MKVGIVTMERHLGKVNIGSSRIRGEWIAKYWDDAEIFVQGQKYDAIIYQKAYWVEHAKLFKGIKILDVCDPDFMHWGYRVKEMIEECDAVTTSTEALAVAFRQFTDKPVVFIPDRMDLDFHKEKKIHEGRAENVVWYGYSQNFPLLQAALPSVVRLKFKTLIVISDRGFVLPSQFIGKIDIINYKWSPRTVNEDIVRGDIVLNPKIDSTHWRFKSNNKTISANLLNMPVAQTDAELAALIEEKPRAEAAEKAYKEAIENYDVKLSVEDYKNLVATLAEAKK